jgi:hypothetical protein
MPLRHPTPKQIAAVRRVLYEPARIRQMRSDLSSISVLLNLENQNPSEIVTWYVPATGELSPGIVEAAARCRRIAATVRAIRSELAKLEFDQVDKRHLLRALDAQAASWQARADGWAAPGQPGDVDALVTTVAGHLRTAFAEAAHVKPYLKRASA